MRALPEEWYSKPEVWIAERRAIFERSWQIVARSIDLPRPGSYLATAIGGLGVIAIRQSDGTVRGFRNLCRHQGMPVLAAGAGTCERIRCPYHGWTYRPDGTLAETPPLVAPENAAETTLRGIGAQERHGFVLLRFDLDANDRPDLPALAALAPALRPMSAGIETCNWKEAMESALAEVDCIGWEWPNLVARADTALVMQPRGFSRTEVVRLPIEVVSAPSRSELAGVFRARISAFHELGRNSL